MKKKLITNCLVAGAFVLGLSTMAGANVITLDDWGDTFTMSDGTVFHELAPGDPVLQSSGTGVIDPFLTIRQHGDEEGYNSDAGNSNLPMDTQRPNWNSSITVQDLVDSAMTITWDINEPDGTKEGLTMHSLQVYVLDSATNTTNYPTLSNGGTAFSFADADLVWDLDGLAEGPTAVDLHYELWNGSGQNLDFSVMFPATILDGYAADDYVIVYAMFGEVADADNEAGSMNFKSQDGYEEARLLVSSVPEPGMMFLFGTGLVGLAAVRLRSKIS